MSASDHLPRAHVVHAISGRTRLVLPARRGDATFFANLADALRALPEVQAADAAPRAGSVVVRHDGGFARIADAAAAAGLFALAPAPPPVAVPARRRPRRRVPPLVLLAGGFAGLGAVQVARGRVAGNAVELLWNGFQAGQRLGRPRVSRMLIGLGLLQLVRGQVAGSASSLLFYALAARHFARERGDLA